MLTPASTNPTQASQSKTVPPRLHGGPGSGPLIELRKMKNSTPKNTIAIAKIIRPAVSNPFILFGSVQKDLHRNVRILL
jgi:hypothetical protein